MHIDKIAVVTWPEVALLATALGDIREIFFANATVSTFPSPQAREAFWHKWTKYYFDHAPDLIYLAINNSRIVGYLMGCADSAQANTQLKAQIPYFDLFADLFSQFPAHLHINVLAQSRSIGVGALLLDAFFNQLKHRNVKGVHIVTSPDARNVNFYKRAGFDLTVTRNWQATPLLFMGKSPLSEAGDNIIPRDF